MLPGMRTTIMMTNSAYNMRSHVRIAHIIPQISYK
jgi:hypothetical protein